MMKLLALPYKIIEHYKILGLQGLILLFKRNLKLNKNFSIRLPNYKFPIYIRNNTTDVTVFYQVFLAKSYQFRVDEKPRVIIDCGANVGMSVVFFKNKFPEAKIIAVEPEYSNFQMLKKNTEMYNDIHCLNSGIWNKEANLILKKDNLENWSFMVEEVDYENENTLKAVSINTIIEKFNIEMIDILKIDIEGSEKDVFDKNFENWLSITKVLVIELHDGLRSGASKSFFSAISKFDFRMIRKDENLIFYLN